MKIGYFGDGIWAHQALKKIIANPEFMVSFIVPRYRKPDLTLKKIADQYNIPFIIHPDVNKKEFLNLIEQYNADIFASMSFNQIFRKEIIGFTPKGFINCHAGALPFYRGRNVLNWAIINDEKSFGVTVHYLDEGIDTGDIILQNFIEIDIKDNYDSVLQKAYNACAETLMESLILIKKNKVKQVKQNSIHPVGFYCGRRIDGDEWLDWDWTTKRIYNFIRAITKPGPCARSYYKGSVIAFIEAELIENSPNYIGTPGEVIGKDLSGIIVKTADNTIRITSIADINENNQLKNERVPDFLIGSRFKNY